MVRFPTMILALAGTGILAATPTFGQEPNPNVSVSERFNPDFAAKGIPAGAFRVFPTLQVGATFDDNIFATENNEEDDIIATVRPGLRIQSEFSRHKFGLNVGGDLGYHGDNSENDFEDVFVGAGGSLEIRRDSVLSADIRWAREHEDRSSADDGGAGNDITTLQKLEAGLTFRQGFNRVFVEVGGGFEQYGFNAQRNSDRDRDEFEPFVRLGYDMSPRVDLFIEGNYRAVRYDETPDDNGQDRNSDGYSAGVGADIDITGVLFGEVGLGFNTTEYDDNNLDDVSGLRGNGKLTWNASKLTSIIATVNAGVRETTVSVNGDAASANSQAGVNLRLEHELRRNIIVDGAVGYTRDDFEGTSRTDNTLRAGAGIRYLINRNISLNGSYGFSNRSSDIDTAEFSRNIIFLGVTARL